MKNFTWIGGLMVALACSAPTWAQSGGIGGGSSEANRFLRQFKLQFSADQLRRDTVERDTRISGSRFGATAIQAPTSLGRSPISFQAPPTSRSATFGVGSGRPSSKPFANISRTPSVSPYLNLFREDLAGNDDLNYQTLVRPQLQQQAVNRQVNLQAQKINQQLTAMAAQNAFNTRGAQNIAPTGHAATFQFYSRFYPAKNQQRRARR